MTDYRKPAHVSEREGAHVQFDGQADDAVWEDCVPCSIVDLANPLVGSAKCPPTLTEAEKLRDAAGYPPTGATDVARYVAAVRARYGLTLQVLSGASDAALFAAVPVGQGASIMGRLSNFPAGHRLRRFQPKYTGLHEWAIAHLPTAWWLVDPLGPQTGYAGEAVTQAEIATFFVGSAGILPLAVIPVMEPELEMIINDPAIDPPVAIDMPIGAQVFDVTGKALFTTEVALVDRLSPYAVTIAAVKYRVFAGKDGAGVRRLLLVADAAVTARQALALDCAAAIAAATAPLETELGAEKAKLAQIATIAGS